MQRNVYIRHLTSLFLSKYFLCKQSVGDKIFSCIWSTKKIFFLTLVSKFRPHSRSFKNQRIRINLFHSKFLLLSQTSLIFNWTLDKMNFTNELKSLSLYFALRMSLIFIFYSFICLLFFWNYVCAVIHEEYNIRTHLFVICHRNIGMRFCSCLFCPEFPLFSLSIWSTFSVINPEIFQ